MPPKPTKRAASASSQKAQPKTSAGNSNPTPNASKSSEADKTPAPKRSALEMLRIVGKCIGLAIGLTLASISFQEILHPLYGSIPTSLHYRKVALGSVMASLLLGFTGLDERGAWIGIASFLAGSPLAALWIGSWAARFGSPVWGPVITQMFIAAPVWCLSAFLLSRWMVSIWLCCEFDLNLLVVPVVSLGTSLQQPSCVSSGSCVPALDTCRLSGACCICPDTHPYSPNFNPNSSQLRGRYLMCHVVCLLHQHIHHNNSFSRDPSSPPYYVALVSSSCASAPPISTRQKDRSSFDTN